MATRIIAIAAMDEGRVIGRSEKLPWNIPADLQRFSELTKGHTVLMGRKTYQSLPEKFRPLPARKNVVVTRNPHTLGDIGGVEVWESLESCLKAAKAGLLAEPDRNVWIIGGAEIYSESLPYWDELYLTLVHSKHEGDAFFPRFEESFELDKREDFADYSFLHYLRVA